ncbi:MAG: fluoride efflux transporter CrcB [Planctomycetales bacterium]|nr:fluoride efflux transporter CrcB [Planctomycetales bacterium]MCA9167510.1 fluoride efflux transporter CrcB [Planctomycetales bacterium]
MTARDLMLVALGGAAGAVCRYVVSVAIQHRWVTHFPLGTFVVNVAGCLLIGMLAQAHQSGALTAPVRLLLVTGGLGALTTFSTFGYETLRSYQDQGTSAALLNISANLVIGLLAVIAGNALGKQCWG